MNVIDKARELGQLIQADERYAEYCKAKEANDKDEDLQKLIGEFQTKRVELNTEMSKDDRSAERLTALDDEIKSLYGTIMSNKNMAAYTEAKNAMEHMLGQINMIITCSSGSCESCGGCH